MLKLLKLLKLLKWLECSQHKSYRLTNAEQPTDIDYLYFIALL